jgi:uncharacterized membrane protein
MSDHHATQCRRSLRVAVWAVSVAIALHAAIQIWELVGVDSGWTTYSPYSTQSSAPASFRVYQFLSFFSTVAWWVAALAGLWNLRALNVRAQARAVNGCTQCEYDSANPSATRCPECGGSVAGDSSTSRSRQAT